MAGAGLGDWSCIIALPQRNDTETLVEGAWDIAVPDGVDFEGQHFGLPDGCRVLAEAHWLEPSLLSVRLSLTLRAEGACARCLRETSLAISDDLLYLYLPSGLDLGEDTRLGSDEGFMPVEVDFFGRTLDIADQVRESILLLLPRKLLCREDCLGLCPVCGADLNEGKCGCSRSEGDPRLEVLRDFQ